MSDLTTSTVYGDLTVTRSLTVKDKINNLLLSSADNSFSITSGNASLIIPSAYSLTLTTTGTTSLTLPTSGTLATTSNKLSAFASTTSSELAGVISDETGSGKLVFATSPTLVTPTLGAATATSINGYTIGHNTHAQNTDWGSTKDTFGIYYNRTLASTSYGIYFGGTSAGANPYIRWNNVDTRFELFSNYTAGTKARLDVGSINGYTIAHDSHSNALDHTRLHSMTGASDHSAGNWKVFYSNGTGQVQELGFGTSGQVLKSNGPSAAPSWQADANTVYSHPVGFTSQPATALSGANVISQITVNNEGHTTAIVSRALTPTDIGASAAHSHPYLSNSTTSIQDGYFGDIHLYDDVTPSHYLKVTNGDNLTAARTLTLKTGDASRTLTLSADVTLSHDSHPRSHTMTSTSDHTAGNWKVFYSNASGQVIELGLGASGQVLKSNGATSAPTWQADDNTIYQHPTHTTYTIDNSGLTVLQDITVNSLGHVTNVVSSDLTTSLNSAYLQLTGGSLTGDLTLATNKTVTLGVTPTNSMHAATKEYVDNAVVSGITWLTPVNVFNLININLATPPSSPSAGDAYHTASNATGVWASLRSKVVQYDGSSWVDLGAVTNGFRAIASSNASGNLSSHKNKIVSYGTAWSYEAPTGGNSVVVSAGYYVNYQFNYNSTLARWVQISGYGQLKAGDGLSISGTTISAVGTANRITVGINGIDIGTDVVTLTGTQTLTNKTLTTPTIASFTNATHNHKDAASGGTIAIADTTGTLSVSKGGTGATSLTGVLKGNGTNTVSTMTSTANYVTYWSDANTLSGIGGNSGILVTSSTGIPSIGTDIPTAVTIGTKYIYRTDGTDVSVADGGTGKSSWTQFGLLYASASTTLAQIGVGTSGQALISGGNAAPSFGTLGLVYGGTNANLSAVATGGLIYKAATALAGTAALTGILKGNGSSAPTALTSTANYVAYWSDANTLTGEQYLSVSRGGTGLGTLAAGRIPFGNGTSAYGSSANLVWDNTNSRLAIGSSAATYGKVEIIADGTNTGGLTLYRGTGTTSRLWLTSNDNLQITHSTEAAGTGLVFDTNNRLGIQTTAPAEALDVTGFIRSSSGYKVGTNTVIDSTTKVTVQSASGNRVAIGKPTNTNATVLLGRASGAPTIKSSGDDRWLIVDSAGQKVALNYFVSDDVLLASGGGKVGVGNTSPNFGLDIEGDSRIRGEGAQRFGGSGASDCKFSVQYNATEDSLDFVYG